MREIVLKICVAEVVSRMFLSEVSERLKKERLLIDLQVRLLVGRALEWWCKGLEV